MVNKVSQAASKQAQGEMDSVACNRSWDKTRSMSQSFTQAD